ncbi:MULTISPECIES: hypothetical protein [unclassified Pseudofrankia]|uniref:hypothetical protein n=1 Tax=unclassified Pseudofrankia TaxID=2994372 RepID=UPI0012FF6F06|nr:MULTISPECIES: hypothetical protein [unclassified Pseudofrankia]MDT3446336.1 hypothetical protein [Pseudofrankia sp. BMG5.37]
MTEAAMASMFEEFFSIADERQRRLLGAACAGMLGHGAMPVSLGGGVVVNVDTPTDDHL